jgi:hypothetical protein
VIILAGNPVHTYAPHREEGMSEPKGRKRPVDEDIVNSRRQAMEDATPQSQSPVEEMDDTEKKAADRAKKTRSPR